ncbi:MAG: hypothetical protein MJ016_06695 [Victivallaceae bacterium]|nr:hypothetical protein [Victivallaceae bacterium]
MKVSLARALKERSRLAGKLKTDFQIINRENSVVKGSNRSFDLHAVLEDAYRVHERLIALKKVITGANAPIAGKLAEMDEIKSMLAYLADVNTTEGYEQRNYGSDTILKEVVVTAAEVQNRMDLLQAKIDALQDELDEFNAATKVELP